MAARITAEPTRAPLHARSPAAVASLLCTDLEGGLLDGEAHARLMSAGPNALERRRSPAYALIAARQLADPLVGLLVVATAVSVAIGEALEGAVIGSLVIVNALLGFVQELGAERAILALRDTLARRANVIRGGRERVVPVEELVPGDLLVLREGDRVPADARLAQVESLAVDESPLTGESFPVDKRVDRAPPDAPLAERWSFVFAGTGVTRGHGRAIVTATGPSAQVGQVASLAAGASPPPTPLQQALRRLTRLMVIFGLAVMAALTAVRIAQGAPAEEAFLLGVSVAVAAVPEGLAATVTIALALGARRMAARGAIVRRLPAVETLGSATVVASDKTGTLTEDDLRLRCVAAGTARTERDVLEAAVLASTAELVDEPERRRAVGDPVETALLLAAVERGVDVERLRGTRTLVRELPFDPYRKRMTIAYAEGGGIKARMKGAAEVVIGRCSGPPGERERLGGLAERWAAEGLRVLAVAEGTHAAGSTDEELERDLQLIGLVALHDPLRPSAPDAVRRAREAGLRVQIVTGDHPATAAAIARELDLPQAAVSARVTPREKLRLVEALQQQGEVVAVTGDGINDAPALRRADVGVAMGRSGTEAAREAAEVVLTDDDFSTIVAAIHEGRTIGDNVRKFVAFLLSANFGEVLLFAAAILAGMGAPMTVVQVLTVNVLTDGLPAVALARDAPEPDVMRRPPAAGRRLFSRSSWAALALVGVTVGAASLGAFILARELDPSAAQSVAFATIALGELLVVFALRSPLRPCWSEPANPLLIASVVGSGLLLALAIYLPPLQDAFGTVALGQAELALVAGFGLVPLVAVELVKAILRRIAPDAAAAALRVPG